MFIAYLKAGTADCREEEEEEEEKAAAEDDLNLLLLLRPRELRTLKSP